MTSGWDNGGSTTYQNGSKDMVTILCIKTSSNDKSYQITAKELVTLSCCNALSANEIYTRVVQDKTRLNSSHLWTRWKCTGKQYLQNYLFTWLPHKPKGCWDFGYSAHHRHRGERRHFIRQLKRCVFQTDYTCIQFDYNFILNERKAEFQSEKETQWLDRFPKQLFTRATGILLAAA